MFGPHLMLDCYGCRKSRLEDIGFIYNFLDKLPAAIGMHKIMPPYTFSFTEGTYTRDWGISGVVIIAESHISAHTFPEKEFVTVDVYSCKNFDTKKAAEYVLALFEPKKFEKKVVMRGRDFPSESEKVSKTVGKIRAKSEAHCI